MIEHGQILAPILVTERTEEPIILLDVEAALCLRVRTKRSMSFTYLELLY